MSEPCRRRSAPSRTTPSPSTMRGEMEFAAAPGATGHSAWCSAALRSPREPTSARSSPSHSQLLSRPRSLRRFRQSWRPRRSPASFQVLCPRRRPPPPRSPRARCRRAPATGATSASFWRSARTRTAPRSLGPSAPPGTARTPRRAATRSGAGPFGTSRAGRRWLWRCRRRFAPSRPTPSRYLTRGATASAASGATGRSASS